MNDNLTNEKKINFDEKLEQARKRTQRKTEDLSLDNALDIAALEAEAHNRGLKINSFKNLVARAEERLRREQEEKNKKGSGSKYDI